MIAWLLASLALVSVGWVPPLDVAGPSRWGWSAPSRGPRDHAGEQPASTPTVPQRDGVAARFLEHGGALQRPAVGPLHRGRPPLVRCRRRPDARARHKRNARAGAHEWVAPSPSLTTAVRTVAAVVGFEEARIHVPAALIEPRPRQWLPTGAQRPALRGAPKSAIQRAPSRRPNHCTRSEGGAVGAPLGDDFCNRL
jgi:hypothetical protein